MEKWNVKKWQFQLLGIVFCILLISGLWSKNVYAVGSMSMNQKEKTLVVGDTYQLKLTGVSKKIKWSSTNSKVVKVNKKGLITAKKVGSATIKAKVSGKTYRCKVTVIYQQKANVLNTIKQINVQRRKYGKVSLKKNEYLMKAAQKRAQELSTKFSASTRPNGTYWTSAISMKYNYKSAPTEIVGRESADVESVIKLWMGNATTQAAILNTRYREIGVGYYVDDFGKGYWAVIFANR